MQSEIVSSSSSLNCNNETSDQDSNNIPSDDEQSMQDGDGGGGGTDSTVNISEKDQYQLVRGLREVEVSLPTIHQEDLVACMRSPAFRALQTANII